MGKLKKCVLYLLPVFAWNHYICVDELSRMISSYLTAKLTQLSALSVITCNKDGN
jgi:hypothetical protein